jgi:hypothetical protein
MEAPLLWFDKSISRRHWSDPNDRSRCAPGHAANRTGCDWGLFRIYARKRASPLSLILSVIKSGHNNRRDSFGTCLGPLVKTMQPGTTKERTAHLKGKEDNR